MRKNKDIVIDLTALLDVIFIMLFWVMTNTHEQSEEAQKQAQNEIMQAQQQVEQEKERADKEIQLAQQDAQIQVEQAQKAAGNSLKNQQALEGYEEGMLLTLNLNCNEITELEISCTDNYIVCQPDEYATEQAILTLLDSMEISSDDVILCALIYDGDKALYREIKNIEAGINHVKENFSGFYCANINTAK